MEPSGNIEFLHSSKYEKMFILGDFNIGIDEPQKKKKKKKKKKRHVLRYSKNEPNKICGRHPLGNLK